MSNYAGKARFRVGDTVQVADGDAPDDKVWPARYEIVGHSEHSSRVSCYLVEEGPADRRPRYRASNSGLPYDTVVEESLLRHALFGVDPETGLGLRTHPLSQCQGRGVPCVIHDPSDHHMRGWTMLWRADRGLMERVCGHGIGHPDPDDIAYKESVGLTSEGVHGCDGCCWTPTADPAKLRKGDYGTYEHCGRREAHAEHWHEAVFNEGPTLPMRCSGQGKPERTPPPAPELTTSTDIHNEILGRTPVPENRYIIVCKNPDGAYDTDWDSQVYEDRDGAVEGMGGTERRAGTGEQYKVIEVDVAAAFEAAPAVTREVDEDALNAVLAELSARGEAKLARKLRDAL